VTEPRGSRRLGRSAIALLAGAVTVVVLSVATDAILQATGVFPPPARAYPDSLLVLATAYRTIFGIAGSYIAARFAPRAPMAHALILGAVGFVMSTVGMLTTWNNSNVVGHRWYPIALIVLALPGAWVGGKLGGKARTRKVNHGSYKG